MNLTIHDAEYLALYLEISELFTGGVVRVATRAPWADEEDENTEEEEEEEEEEEAPETDNQTNLKTFTSRLLSAQPYKDELIALASLVPEGEITATVLLGVLNEKYTPLISPTTRRSDIMSADLADWEYDGGWMRSFC